MPKRRVLLVTLLVSALVLPSLVGLTSAKDDGPEVKAAEAAAKRWLAQVDGGDFAGSWDSSATYFQRAVTKSAWSTSLESVRTPLGRVSSRELIAAKRTSQLPGAPDGDYVVLQFRTSFAAKKDAVETVTPMKDGERGWRVSGYYIK